MSLQTIWLKYDLSNFVFTGGYQSGYEGSVYQSSAEFRLKYIEQNFLGRVWIVTIPRGSVWSTWHGDPHPLFFTFNGADIASYGLSDTITIHEVYAELTDYTYSAEFAKAQNALASWVEVDVPDSLYGTGSYWKYLDYVWLSQTINIGTLFTAGDDKDFDFNNLTSVQTKEIDSGAVLYQALAGNDTVSLPDSNHQQLTTTVKWVNGNEFDAGPGKDLITLPAGFGSTRIFGGDNTVKGFLDTDTIKLPGSADQYRFKVVFDDAGGTWAATKTQIYNSADLLLAEARSFEAVRFDTAATNSLTVNLVSEAARLAWEVYGPHQTFTHGSEALAYAANSKSSETTDVSAAAARRGWHPLSALELGILPADFSGDADAGGIPSGLKYSFAGGHYQSTGMVPVNEANALVLVGGVNGVRTLAIAFRGTDQEGDFFDYPSFQTHYSKFAPLLAGLKSYLADSGNAVGQILVTGHSLGAGMVQKFLADGWGAIPVKAYTFGSPGSDGASGLPSNAELVNFIHTQDPVTKVPDGTNLNELKLFGLNKVRVGTDILLQSDISSSVFSFEEHAMSGYVQEIDKLVAYAGDASRAYNLVGLASYLRNPQASYYTGGSVQLATGGLVSMPKSVPAAGPAGLYSFSGYQKISHSIGADDYVIGSEGDDRIYLEGPFSDTGTHVRYIDGGAGNNSVFINTSSSQWAINRFGDGGKLTWLGGDGSLAFPSVELHRIARVVFTTGDEANPFSVETFSGAGPTVQKSSEAGAGTGGAAGAANGSSFKVSASADVASVPDSELAVDGSTSDDIVFFGGATRQVSGGAGADILLAKANSATPDPSNEMTIDGGAGADLMRGGRGKNTFIVDDAGDSILDGGGLDTVRSSVSYSLPAGIENLVLVSGGLTGRGNDASNLMTGSDGEDVLEGDAGDDVYVVQNIGDTMVELPGEGTDRVESSVTYTLPANVEIMYLTGTANIDATGNALANRLVGNAGVNTLTGGDGDDVYVLQNIGDVVFELPGQGRDRMETPFTTTIPANFEDLTLTGNGDVNVTGNGADNLILGNIGINVLAGGLGNDTYGVDNAGDMVIEIANEGTDTIISSVNYTLPANVENLRLGGSGNLNGGGNAGNNFLIGNKGDNALTGSGGSDAFFGGAGVDTAVIPGTKSDYTMSYAGGQVTLKSGLSILTLSGIESVRYGDGITQSVATLYLERGRDADGDGKADIYWRNIEDGRVSAWLMDGLSLKQGEVFSNVPLEWQVQDTLDLDGDGKSDLLWRNVSDGRVSTWLMDGLTVKQGEVFGNVPLEWRVQGSADFDGDGRGDILWRNVNDGRVSAWLMNGLTVIEGTVFSDVPLDWQIQRTGDFDGDGQGDILWRNTQDGSVSAWLMKGLTVKEGTVFSNVPLEWRIQRTGDFDADGHTDVLWRNTKDGEVSSWLMDGLSVKKGAVFSNVPLEWQISGTGDFNNDLKTDILWRHTDGSVSQWLMDGLDVLRGSVFQQVPTNWAII